MADEDAYSEENQAIVIPEDHFVTGVDFDADPPFVKICYFDGVGLSSKDKKIEVPKALAYYLQTHSCGSDKMRALIREHAVSDYKDKLKKSADFLRDALGPWFGSK